MAGLMAMTLFASGAAAQTSADSGDTDIYPEPESGPITEFDVRECGMSASRAHIPATEPDVETGLSIKQLGESR